MNQDSFLSCGEEVFHVFLGGGAGGEGFGFGIAEGGELFGEFFGGRGFIGDGGAEIGGGFGDGGLIGGRGLGVGILVLAIAVTAASAALASATGAGIALGGHEGFDFGLEHFPFVIGSGKLLFDSGELAFTGSGGIEITALAALSAVILATGVLRHGGVGGDDEEESNGERSDDKSGCGHDLAPKKVRRMTVSTR